MRNGFRENNVTFKSLSNLHFFIKNAKIDKYQWRDFFISFYPFRVKHIKAVSPAKNEFSITCFKGRLYIKFSSLQTIRFFVVFKRKIRSISILGNTKTRQ